MAVVRSVSCFLRLHFFSVCIFLRLFCCNLISFKPVVLFDCANTEIVWWFWARTEHSPCMSIVNWWNDVCIFFSAKTVLDAHSSDCEETSEQLDACVSKKQTLIENNIEKNFFPKIWIWQPCVRESTQIWWKFRASSMQPIVGLTRLLCRKYKQENMVNMTINYRNIIIFNAINIHLT